MSRLVIGMLYFYSEQVMSWMAEDSGLYFWQEQEGFLTFITSRLFVGDTQPSVELLSGIFSWK